MGVAFVALTTHTAMRYSFGLLLPSMVEGLDGSLSVITAAFSLHMAIYTLSAPLAGIWISVVSERVVMLAGAAMAGAAMTGMAAATATWQILILYGVVAAVASHGFGVILSNHLVVPRFQRRLGLAVGIVNSGVSFGAAAGPPVVGLIVSRAGWRDTWSVVGVTTMIVLALASMFIRRRPEGVPATGNPADGADAPSPPHVLSPLLRVRAFWLVSAGLCSAMFVHQTLVVQIASSGLSRGLSIGETGFAVGVLGITGVALRIGFSELSDRLPQRVYVAIIGTIVTVTGLVLLGVFPGPAGFWFALVPLGAGMSVYGPLFAMLVADTFPTRPYARTMGVAMLGVGLGSAAGPLLFAQLRSIGVSDGTSWLTLIPFSVVSAVLLVAGARRRELAARPIVIEGAVT